MALFERLICSSVPLDFPPPLFYHIVPADTVESTQTETANYTAMSSIEGLSDDISMPNSPATQTDSSTDPPDYTPDTPTDYFPTSPVLLIDISSYAHFPP